MHGVDAGVHIRIYVHGRSQLNAPADVSARKTQAPETVQPNIGHACEDLNSNCHSYTVT